MWRNCSKPQTLCCINLHNLKWPVFAFHAQRPEYGDWLAQYRARAAWTRGGRHTFPGPFREHGEPELSGHMKGTFNRPNSNITWRKDKISPSHLQKAPQKFHKIAPAQGALGSPTEYRIVFEVNSRFQNLEMLKRPGKTHASLLSLQLRLKQ